MGGYEIDVYLLLEGADPTPEHVARRIFGRRKAFPMPEHVARRIFGRRKALPASGELLEEGTGVPVKAPWPKPFRDGSNPGAGNDRGDP